MAKIFAVFLHGADREQPNPRSFRAEESSIEILRETAHCWYLLNAPQGFPERFNKSEEYTMQRNKFGFYMFGLDAAKLTAAWNRAVGVLEL